MAFANGAKAQDEPTTAFRRADLDRIGGFESIADYVADDYQLAGVISFYTPQHPWPYSFGKSARNIWTSLPELKRQGALLVCFSDHCPQDREKARRLFSKIDKLREIQNFQKEKVVKTFEVYYVRN